jgi:hypothetical protein
LIPPDDNLKFQIKSTLHMYGVETLESKLDEIADAVYDNIFHKNNVASIRDVLFEIQEESERS